MPKLPAIVPDARCEPETQAPKPWFVYLVRAANGALYCGISDDPQRRFAQHQRGKGARFFYSSPAQALVYVEACADKAAALREERGIKQLKKSAKEALVASYVAVANPSLG
jgi:putative endonuclease